MVLEAVPKKEKVSRISAIGRADIPISLQRTESLTDIVVPDDPAMNQKPLDELVFFLDLDKCAIYGQDGNDLAIAMQWMHRPVEALRGLYRRLINPQLLPLYRQLDMSVEKMPVVLYTMRPQLLRYKSQVRRQRMKLRWKSTWHHTEDQVLIPPTVREASQVLDEYSGDAPLHPQERIDLLMSFERLLAIRDVIQAELGLAEPPPIVVAAAVKNVQMTATKLGFSPARAYLWDDNPLLEGQPHVLTVKPFVAMPPSRKEEVLRYLREQLPEEGLTDEVVEFMTGAQADTCSLQVDASGTRRYSLFEAPLPINKFPIPDLPIHYPTPTYALDAERSIPHMQRTNGGCSAMGGTYCSSLAEFYSFAWRKPDLDSKEKEAQRQWKESMEMVW